MENQVFVYWGSGGMNHSVTDTHIDSLIYWSNGWNCSVSVFPGNLEKRPGHWMCSYWSQHYWKPVYKLKSSSNHWNGSKKINIATLYPCLLSLNNTLGKKKKAFIQVTCETGSVSHRFQILYSKLPKLPNINAWIVTYVSHIRLILCTTFRPINMNWKVVDQK